MRKLLTILEASAMLKVSVHTLYKWVAAKPAKIPHVYVNGALRFPEDMLDAWVDERTVVPS